MGTTTHGLRYPAPSDPVAAGALNMRNLAEDVDALNTTTRAGLLDNLDSLADDVEARHNTQQTQINNLLARVAALEAAATAHSWTL